VLASIAILHSPRERGHSHPFQKIHIAPLKWKERKRNTLKEFAYSLNAGQFRGRKGGGSPFLFWPETITAGQRGRGAGLSRQKKAGLGVKRKRGKTRPDFA